MKFKIKIRYTEGKRKKATAIMEADNAFDVMQRLSLPLLWEDVKITIKPKKTL